MSLLHDAKGCDTIDTMEGAMIELSETQRLALQNGEAVHVPASNMNEGIVLLRGEDFERIQALLQDDREKAAWTRAARQATRRWAKENPY
ncbi:MAG: hypothetical protein FJ271_12815 [Planctomycetes bacterium]|nr:hypothetical protein [Planctomycetota bacterium]